MEMWASPNVSVRAVRAQPGGLGYIAEPFRLGGYSNSCSDL